jgi:CYTH domain-containing protein
MLRGLDEELQNAKYAHIERERRFLVDSLRRPNLIGARFYLIEDRYIDTTRFRLRRMTDSLTGRVVMKLSKKYDVADVTARPLTTAYLSAAEYALFEGLPSHLLRKRRYPVETPHGFGIDLFEGELAGLELAEIEFADAASGLAIAPPDWTIREVTHDPRYQGGNLVQLTAAEVVLLHAPVISRSLQDLA